MDVQYVEATNDGINVCNDRALPVLQAITGQDLGVEPEKWKSWWTDQLGYAYQSAFPRPSPRTPTLSPTATIPPHGACFAAGTLVQTIDGPRPIESIRVGDRVLSQGTSTGQLAFQPVVAIHRNQPAATLRIAIGGESIVATGIHRFWKAGKGWTMARELKAGDRLRMVGGIVEIESIEADKTQPVYNLDVAHNRDFFVGTEGLLVHDFSFVQPVAEPFDRQPELGSPVPDRSEANPCLGAWSWCGMILVCFALVGSQGAGDDKIPAPTSSRHREVPGGSEQGRPRSRRPYPPGALV